MKNAPSIGLTYLAGCLVCGGRAQTLQHKGLECWVASERVAFVDALCADASTQVELQRRSRFASAFKGGSRFFGPVTTNEISPNNFSLDPKMVLQAFLSLETQGLLMRGSFERTAATDELDTEWCERRILQRIHKLTIATRRRQVEPVSPAKFMQWLLGWQHLAPQTQVSGRDGLLGAISKTGGDLKRPRLSGRRRFSHRASQKTAGIPAGSISFVCPGVVSVGGAFHHIPLFTKDTETARRRVILTNASPITFYLRDSAAWLDLCTS